MPAAATDKLELCRQRKSIFQLLADIYRRELEAGALALIFSEQFLDVLSSVGVSLQRPDDPCSQEYITELAAEYAHLFLGPGPHISPYESVHRTGDNSQPLLWGESTASFKRFVEAAGLNFTAETESIPDHIATELEFMARLIEAEINACNDGDSELITEARILEGRLLELHLMKWVPGFCEKVIEQAELPFYREIARLTSAFLEYDFSQLKQEA